MGDVSCGVSHTLASSAIVEETQGDGNDRMKVMTGGRLYVAGPANVLGRYCPTFTRVQARSLGRRTTPAVEPTPPRRRASFVIAPRRAPDRLRRAAPSSSSSRCSADVRRRDAAPRPHRTPPRRGCGCCCVGSRDCVPAAAAAPRRATVDGRRLGLRARGRLLPLGGDHDGRRALVLGQQRVGLLRPVAAHQVRLPPRARQVHLRAAAQPRARQGRCEEI